MSTFTSINIETLILVAVWEKPFVFQGCFKLTDKSKNKQRLLFFRCECDKTDKKELIEQAFSAYEYQFSHLYDGAQPIRLSECHRPRLMLHPPATRSDPLRVNFFILFVTLLVKFWY